MKPIIDIFPSIAESVFSSTHKSYTVHPNDKELFGLLKLETFHGTIAGGTALNWYQNYPVGNHDVDIFFQSITQYRECFQYFIEHDFFLDHSSNDADTFSVTTKNKIEYKVQLIKTRFGDTPEKIINDFDISVAKIATDGHRWYMGKTFAQDLKNKVLRFDKIGPTSLKRYIKYQSYGYEPEAGLWDRIVTTPGLIWDFENHTGDYDAN